MSAMAPQITAFRLFAQRFLLGFFQAQIKENSSSSILLTHNESGKIHESYTT